MFQGEWWIPGQEDHKLFGTLIFEEERITLQIIGEFFDRKILTAIRQLDVIHGVISGYSEEGGHWKDVHRKYIILEECFIFKTDPRSTEQRLAPSMASVKFFALNAYIVPNEDGVRNTDLIFHEAHVALSHLPGFVGMQEGPEAAEYKYRNEEDEYPESFEAQFKYQNYPTLKIGEITLGLEYSVNPSMDTDLGYKFTVQPDIVFKLSSPEAMTIDRWKTNFIRPLKHFLILGTNETCVVTKILLHNKKNYKSYIVGENKNKKEIRSSTIFKFVDEEILKSKSKKYNPVFRESFVLKDIIDELPIIMRKWFSLYDKHKMVQNLFFETLLLSNVYLEDRFLNLARALEIFHSKKYSGGIMSSEAFKAKRDGILNQVKVEDREWLKGKLDWANKLTLQDRLQRLFSDLSELEIPQELGVEEEFISARVRKGRNELTHYGKSSTEVSSFELIQLSYFMEYVLKGLLLKEIGLPPSLIKKNGNYDHQIKKLKNLYDKK